jgi:hypothetical protein
MATNLKKIYIFSFTLIPLYFSLPSMIYDPEPSFLPADLLTNQFLTFFNNDQRNGRSFCAIFVVSKVKFGL